jgi:IMP dehydrogenase/GMP reductase
VYVRLLPETSRTLKEFLLVPGLTTKECLPESIDLGTGVVRHEVGTPSPIRIATPLVSAIMQAVSSPTLAIALARSGGLSFIHQNQPVDDQAADVRAIKMTSAQETDTDASLDSAGRFRVGAGINTRDYRQRVPALVEAGADVVCLDSSDGYSEFQRHALEYVRSEYDTAVFVGAGNVVDANAFRYLAEAGADFVKVGIGGGSICITRDQKGIGRGQATALMDVVAARDTFAARTGQYVPICCDGGLLNDYHMAIALAMGADFIMLGRYFARFDEAPSEVFSVNGSPVKEYWGEGSRRARNAARYGQDDVMVFEEGVDGVVPYVGGLSDTVRLTRAKLRATLSSCGARTLREFHDTAVLTQVSARSFEENTAQVMVRDGVLTAGA